MTRKRRNPGLEKPGFQSIDKVDALPSKVCKQSFDCSPRALRCARARVSGGNPRITRPQPIFDGRSGTSISCKMAFSALTGQKTLILRPEIDRGSNLRLPALGYRPAFAENDPLDHFPGASAPGDVHAFGCRPASTENHPLDDFPGVSAPADYNRRGCGPFDASQEFVDSLKRRNRSSSVCRLSIAGHGFHRCSEIPTVGGTSSR